MNTTDTPQPNNNEHSHHWHAEMDDQRIAWLHLDQKDTNINVLSLEVLKELENHLHVLAEGRPKGLVLLSDKPSGFIAGADVEEFSKANKTTAIEEHIRWVHSIFHSLEAFPCATFPCPTVALLNGFCLGGGLELALACDYRIARDTPTTRLGFPEVRLGLLPGYGGTVRSTRIIGALPALNMMLRGNSVSAATAKKMGLVDWVVPERYFYTAAKRIITERPTLHRPSRWTQLASHRLLRPMVAQLLRHHIKKRVRQKHYPAPFCLIEHWQAHADNPVSMYGSEAQKEAELLTGEIAPNLIRVFGLQNKLKSLGKKQSQVRYVHVIGAGVMGGDIAAWCALQGLQVTLQDRTPEALGPALQRANTLFHKRLGRRGARKARDRLLPDLAGDGLGRAEVVIEAVFEDSQVKQALYAQIEPQLQPKALLATNTSSIPLEQLRKNLNRPERLVGLHFFNPVAKMQLVEVVHSPEVDPLWVEQAIAFTRRLDKLPLPVKSTPGFLVNRILMPYLLEAVQLESEGYTPEAIDQAALDFGMPMGPVELADTVGLDICLSVAEIVGSHLGLAVPKRLREQVQANKLGRKSGQGFYRFDRGQVHKRRFRNRYSPELQERLILRFLNEVVACLREGVVADADTLDAGLIFGTGFAPFRGGPMHYIKQTGATHLHHQLQMLAQRHGNRFQPDPRWESLEQK